MPRTMASYLPPWPVTSIVTILAGKLSPFFCRQPIYLRLKIRYRLFQFGEILCLGGADFLAYLGDLVLHFMNLPRCVIDLFLIRFCHFFSFLMVLVRSYCFFLRLG